MQIMLTLDNSCFPLELISKFLILEVLWLHLAWNITELKLNKINYSCIIKNSNMMVLIFLEEILYHFIQFCTLSVLQSLYFYCVEGVSVVGKNMGFRFESIFSLCSFISYVNLGKLLNLFEGVSVSVIICKLWTGQGHCYLVISC